MDTVVDLPVDYHLFSELVRTFAGELASQFSRSRPVAVQIGNGLARSILDLALVKAEVSQLIMPTTLSASDTAAAVAWNGAHAAYLNSPIKIQLRNSLPIAPLQGHLRLLCVPSRGGKFKQVSLSVDLLVEIAATLVHSCPRQDFDRHLALLPAWSVVETAAGFYATIIAGGTYVVPPPHRIGLENPQRPDFVRLARALGELRITSLVIDRGQLAGLVSVIEACGSRLPLLKRVMVDGRGLPSALVERCRAAGLQVTTLAQSASFAAPVIGLSMAQG
ncbi:hypothetical protein KRR38_09775 [Novosphingobium sp. G106]|uniref:hypothetical protein n=1 Tax=Novosphingobium sp. G106 TaxID=2849500 RepID=UPI001C2CE1F2|nr:hypothetical protein [Novosphingobium sp. G106]MBV1687954.1 hypothetical protein [Novosphingobium sp. G106]